MKIFLILCSVTSLILAEETSILQEYSKGNQALTNDLYKEIIKENQGKNIIFSPFSAQTILGLTAIGTNGDTLKELTTSLHLPSDIKDIKTTYSTLLPTIKGEKYSLTSANKVYIKDGFKIKQEFQDAATNIFQSAVENINFADGAAASGKINKWVEENTNNNIKNLVQPEQVTSDTLLILVNALHFKASWIRKFDKRATIDMDFFKTDKEKVKVPFMGGSENLNYLESAELNAKIVELPYEGNDVSMVLVVPNEIQGLSALEGKAGPAIYNISDKLKKERLFLRIPKFKLETQLPLVKILKQLGIRQLFDSAKADLKGITDANIFVSDVIQKAFIEVNEDGTEASAATFAKITPRTGRKTTPFTIDRPFLFYIKHRNNILFAGRVLSP